MTPELNVIPNPEIDIFPSLKGCKFFTAIDLTTAYYSVRVHEGSQKYTAVILRDGRKYAFTRMPMGFAAAGTHFNTELQVKFKDMKFVHIYLDDLIIASHSYEEHCEHIKRVFQRLDDLKLTVALYKCQFGFRELNYLGYTLGVDGLKMREDKIDLIQNLPQPKNRKGVKRVLGVTGFYRKFIHQFADITAPLSDLLNKDAAFKWGPEQQSAFERLKTAIANDVKLQLPDFDKEFIIHCDASDQGIAGVLLQRDDEGNLRPISFASRKLTKAERNYTITERELLAIVFSTMKWRHYIHLTHFTILTDHKALLYFSELKNLTGRLARWYLTLQSLDYTLEFIEGKL
eukprot:Nk52_evm1s2541 gene=Nk52_evmTU1s2541